MEPELPVALELAIPVLVGQVDSELYARADNSGLIIIGYSRWLTLVVASRLHRHRCCDTLAWVYRGVRRSVFHLLVGFVKLATPC